MFGTKLFGLSAALLCVAAAPAPQLASAATTNSTEASAAASAPAPAQTQAAPKKTCKLLESSGTRFAKRTCLTADEWKKVEADLTNQ
jgi:hypothetical protein